ncbi:MAG: prolipoprotein diacylglyceryl transferase [Elusimicrobia bacterium]|nr:prolipoprotein diacylglyceryl transferase [Elusimicrobiota bacterium]
MFPNLFSIGPFTLHTYGLLVALGTFLSLQLTLYFAKKDGFGSLQIKENLYELFFYLLVSGILGARFFFVLTHLKEFIGDLLSIFKVWQGGLVSFGGLFGASLGFLAWKRKNKNILPWKKALDWCAPALSFGHALGRLGCLSSGCCFGAPTDKAWGIIFDNPQSLAPLWVSLHPTQIYEFIFLFFLGSFLWWKSLRKKILQSADGMLFAQYLILYSLGRFFIDFFRGDEEKIFHLTPGQNFSILVFLSALFLRKFVLRSNSKQTPLGI